MGNPKSIIIIGGGIAGLSAGCYGQMNGYRTRIFEKNSQAGGACTSWKRGNYTINGCLYWLLGSASGHFLNEYWKELNALQGQTIINHDRFVHLENIEGKDLIFYSDVNRFEEHLLDIAPEDKDVISELIADIRYAINHDLPEPLPSELFTISDGMDMLFNKFRTLRKFSQWSKISMREYASSFKSPVLRKGLLEVWNAEMPLSFFILSQAWMHLNVMGYVKGGAMVFERPIEETYHELGGEMILHSPVEKILRDGNKVIGIRLENGLQYYADYVIGTSDGYTILYKMLGEQYIEEKVKSFYKTMHLFKPIVFAAFGINKTFNDIPAAYMGHDFALAQPIKIAGIDISRLCIQVYNFDPTLAPEGKTLITCIIETDYDFWNEIYKDSMLYQEAQDNIIAMLSAALEQRFPGISPYIEMTDLSTPVTYHKYTGCYRGAYEGWMPTVNSVSIRMKKTLKGIDNFYMAGQWVEPGGGIPAALMSGRNVIRLICDHDNITFSTERSRHFHHHD